MSLAKHRTTSESSWGTNTTPVTGAWTDYLSSRPFSGKSDDTSMSGYGRQQSKKGFEAAHTCSHREESEQYGTTKDGHVKV